MSQQKKKFLEVRIEDLKGTIENRSWNLDRKSIQIVEAARRSLREAEIELQLLVEEEKGYAERQ